MDNKNFKFIPPNKWFTQRVKIDVIGVGGTGSEVLASLARINYAIRELGHPGLSVKAWDGDVVEKPNVGRQAFYPADIGHNKALLTIQRINYLYGFDWEAEPTMFDVNAKHDLGDLVISCVDVAQFRADFAKEFDGCYSHTYWIDTGNGSHTGQVILGRLGSYCDQLPNVFDLYPNLDGMVEDNTPSCSMEEALAHQDLPINRAIANAVMQMIWMLLRHGGIDFHGVFVDIRKGITTPINIMA